MESGPRLSAATMSLIAAIGTAAALLLLLPFSAALERRLLASHHLRPSSTASWIVVGLLPKMYGGRHEAWLSPEPLSDYLRRDLGRAPFEVAHQWVNHYPARLVRLDTVRRLATEAGAPVYVRVESSYRRASLTSRYAVRPTARGLDVRIEP